MHRVVDALGFLISHSFQRMDIVPRRHLSATVYSDSFHRTYVKEYLEVECSVDKAYACGKINRVDGRCRWSSRAIAFTSINHKRLRMSYRPTMARIAQSVQKNE